MLAIVPVAQPMTILRGQIVGGVRADPALGDATKGSPDTIQEHGNTIGQARTGRLLLVSWRDHGSCPKIRGVDLELVNRGVVRPLAVRALAATVLARGRGVRRAPASGDVLARVRLVGARNNLRRLDSAEMFLGSVGETGHREGWQKRRREDLLV